MECERFKKLLKSWYIQVQNESLAPARMVEFMENHVADCSTCLMDPEAKKDIAKIITLILPQDKLRQTVKSSQGGDSDELADEESDDTGSGTDDDVVEDDELDEDGESDDDSEGDADDDELEEGSEEEE